MKGDSNVSKKARFRFGSGICNGDIILSTVPKSAISAAIRLGTFGRFSHAAIYRGEMNVLEAIGPGVTNYNIMRRGVYDVRNVCILRLKDEIPRRQELAVKAAMAAEEYRNRGYWKKGAVFSVLGSQKTDTQKRMFCSHFVAQVYADAGIKLCRHIEAASVTPNNIHNSNVLHDVTRDVIVAIPSWLLDTGDFEAIDVEQVQSPVYKRLSQEREILVEINDVLKQYGLEPATTIDDVIRVLVVEAPSNVRDSIDEDISRILESRNFCEPGVIGDLSQIQDCNLDPWGMPLLGLKATIGLHHELYEKLKVRLEDHEGELEAGQQLFDRKSLQTLVQFQRRLSAMHELLQREIENLSEEIIKLEEIYQRRDLHHSN